MTSTVTIAKRKTALGWAAAAVAIGALLAHAFYYLPFLSDDTLISLRYAARLLDGDGLTWTDGRPVEGYSNLLWVLLTALAGALGVDLVFAARALGVLGMGAGVACMAVCYLRSEVRPGTLVGLAVGLGFYVGAAPIAVWAVGGLEQPLVAALLAGAVALYWRALETDFQDRRAAVGLAVLLGLLCLTRPDSPLFTVAFAGATVLSGWLSGRRWPWGFLLTVVGVPLLFYGGQLVFRLVYYGEWVPNTALVKLAPSAHHARGGLAYVAQGLLSLSPLSIVALASIAAGLARRDTRDRILPLALIAGLWLGYLVVIGGDIFPAHRHLVALVVVLSYALVEGVSAAWRWAGTRTVHRVGLAAGLAALTALTVALQFGHPENVRAAMERWEWQGRALGLTLKEAFSDDDPLLAVTAAGALPYWSELPAVDLLGLNDYYLPRNKPADFGSGLLGHELGSVSYLLQRAPDLVVLGAGTVDPERSPRYRKEFGANEDFQRQYELVRVQTAVPPRFRAFVFFRVPSAKVGLRPQAGEVHVPAYLLNAFEHTTAHLREDRLVLEMDAARPAGAELLGLGGRWDVEVRGPDAEQVEATLEQAEGAVRLLLTTESAAPLVVESVVLTEPEAEPSSR